METVECKILLKTVSALPVGTYHVSEDVCLERPKWAEAYIVLIYSKPNYLG